MMKNLLTLLLLLFTFFGCKKEVETTPTTITEIYFEDSEVSMSVGDVKTLNVIHSPASLPTPTYTWQMSDNYFDVVSLTQSGGVTALKVGNVYVTVSSDGGLEAICLIKVEYTTVEQVVLDETELTLDIGDEYKLGYQILPENATGKTVTWSSSDNSIASVSSSGVIKAINEGVTQVKIESSNGYSDVCNVSVNYVHVDDITLSESKLSIEDSETTQLSVIYSPTNATNKEVVWSSSDTSVATVDGNGLVTGLRVGTAIITATAIDGGDSALCEVDVTEIAVKGITLNSQALYLAIGGGTYLLEAYTVPSNAYNQNMLWSSSNTSVVTVSDGLITPISVGTSIITVTTEDGEYAAQCTVYVNAKENYITINAAYGSLSVGTSGAFFSINTRFINSSNSPISINQVLLMEQSGTIISRTDYLGYVVADGSSYTYSFMQLPISYDFTQFKVGYFYTLNTTTYYVELSYNDWTWSY